MLKVVYVVAAFVLLHLTVGAQSTISCSVKSGLTAVEIDDLLKAHNALRAEQTLAPLIWDCKLAEAAQEWASRGVAAHREDVGFGENLFVSSISGESAISAVERWRREKDWWNNQTVTCLPGKMCTHYTQIMWRASKKLGCGINRNADGKWKLLLVCNYDPAGNYGVGPPF